MANLKYKDNNGNWQTLNTVRGPKGDNADITLNGQTHINASFYAPEQSGTAGQFLTSYGSGNSPVWVNLSRVAATGNYDDLNSKPIIPTTTNDIISGSTAALTSGGAFTALAQRGIPSGGSSGQVLIKSSATNYDCSWGTLTKVATADYPTGFNSKSTSQTWGNQTGTYLTGWVGPSNSEIAFRNNGGQLNIILDGVIYQNEGQKKVLDVDDFYYKSGDTISVSGDSCLAGYLTSSGTNIQFGFPVVKSLKNISSITVSTCKVNVRAPSGGYVGTSAYVSGGFDFKTICSCTATKNGDSLISVSMTKNSGNFGYTNNTPVSVSQFTLVFTLN